MMVTTKIPFLARNGKSALHLRSQLSFFFFSFLFVVNLIDGSASVFDCRSLILAGFFPRQLKKQHRFYLKTCQIKFIVSESEWNECLLIDQYSFFHMFYNNRSFYLISTISNKSLDSRRQKNIQKIIFSYLLYRGVFVYHGTKGK